MVYLENTSKTALNAMILGQTGVGKSSLVNYLFELDETNELASGAGAPVTPEGEFAKKTIRRESLDITIYDSWGLENKQIEKWEETIFAKIDSLKESFETQIHAIIYCISYSKSRIQDFEIQFISDLLKKKEHVIIALTQADCGTLETKQEYHRILSERLSDFKDLYDVVEVRSVAKPKIGQSTNSCYKYGREELFKAVSANYLIYLVFKKMEAWESHIEAVVRDVTKLDDPFFFNKDNDSIAGSTLKTLVWPSTTNLSSLVLKLISKCSSLTLGKLVQNFADEASESLTCVIKEINTHIKNFQKDLHVDSMLFAWGEYVNPGTREVGVWDLFKEMLMKEPVKGDIRLVSFCCWVKKLSASIKIKYLNTLSDNHRAKIFRDSIHKDWKKMVVLCYSFQFLGKRISRDLFIKGVSNTDVFKSKLADFTMTNHILPSEILVYYDDVILVGKECFALTSDKFYYHNGDELKLIDLETNGSAIYPIMEEITKANQFSDVRSELKSLLIAITKDFS